MTITLWCYPQKNIGLKKKKKKSHFALNLFNVPTLYIVQSTFQLSFFKFTSFSSFLVSTFINVVLRKLKEKIFLEHIVQKIPYPKHSILNADLDCYSNFTFVR